MNIYSSYTHHQAFMSLFSVGHKRRYFKECWKPATINFHSTKNKYYGSQVSIILQNIFFCAQQKHSSRFRICKGWVNDQVWVYCLFKRSKDQLTCVCRHLRQLHWSLQENLLLTRVTLSPETTQIICFYYLYKQTLRGLFTFGHVMLLFSKCIRFLKVHMQTALLPKCQKNVLVSVLWARNQIQHSDYLYLYWAICISAVN